REHAAERMLERAHPASGVELEAARDDEERVRVERRRGRPPRVERAEQEVELAALDGPAPAWRRVEREQNELRSLLRWERLGYRRAQDENQERDEEDTLVPHCRITIPGHAAPRHDLLGPGPGC